MSPLLQRPGAVAADGRDSGVAAHYGDPLREQLRFAERSAVVDLSHRGIIAITGPDRLSWLHSLVTQDIDSLRPGHAVESLVLDPNGHIEHEFVASDDGETLWLHTETTGELLSWLDSMRFMLRVEVADRSSEFAVLATAVGEFRRIPRAALAELSDELAGIWAYEALRIASLTPRFGLDSDERSIPNESRWLHTAVHLSKGCYRGQETVARVANLGQAPRRTLLVHLDGSADRLPAHKAPVEVDGRAIGWLGSAARHYELGPIGLVVVKRAAADQVVATGGFVEIDGIAGQLEHDDLQAPKDRPERPELLRF